MGGASEPWFIAGGAADRYLQRTLTTEHCGCSSAPAGEN